MTQISKISNNADDVSNVGKPSLSSLPIVKRDRYSEKKMKCVHIVEKYLDEAVSQKSIKGKKEVARKIFRFLATHNCQHILIKNHVNFKITVQNKLIEFDRVEKWNEAKYWYEKIFHEPIPKSYIYNPH